MKKILFAALAALAITSCSQNEIDGIDNGKHSINSPFHSKNVILLL